LCANPEHDVDKIDFEINEEGEELGPVILSQIVNDQGKVVAQLCISSGNDGQKRGEVYIMNGSQLDENGWHGEPFQSLTFEDFHKILSPEQIKERKEKIEKSYRLHQQKELIEKQKRLSRRFGICQRAG